jgi:tetraprenyl-beta-curcumene synthase
MGPGTANDPLPLSGRQLGALARTTVRELAWGLPEFRRETRKWIRLAARIPDESIRADALRSFESKRGNMAGAALFTTLPRHRSRELLRALVSFQTIFDFLDDLHERHPTAPNGQRLYLALIDALIPGGHLPDYYAQHPRTDDGGYLVALVEDCRRQCDSLPSFASVQPLLIQEARRAHRALALNHLPDPDSRDRALRNWAGREFRNQEQWRWFELTAAASGQLAIFALLALAAKPELGADEVEATYRAYWPVMPLLTTMLDSYADQAEDTANDDHRYVSHYRDPGPAVDRLAELIALAAREVAALPDGHRHAVILARMASFYLSKPSARTPAVRAQTKRLLRAGGSLPRALAPVLRIWRTAHGQRSA